MSRLSHLSGRSLLGYLAAALLSLAGAHIHAQVSADADVEYSSVSQKDPHPITYSWTGKEAKSDPGPYFYTFFYTGTVNPDARVSQDTKIERIPVPMDEWENSRKWIIAKLTLYYQLTNNQAPTAIMDLSGGFQAGVPVPPATGAGAPAATGEAANTNQGAGVTPAPAGPGVAPEYGGMNTGNQPGNAIDSGIAPPPAQYFNTPPSYLNAPGGGFGGWGPPSGLGGWGGSSGGGDTGFNPRAAAEWTFYYDQLVLWQYYCARNLLNNMEQDLLESAEPTSSQSGQMAEAGQSRGARGAGGRGAAAGGGIFSSTLRQEPITPVDIASSISPGAAGRQNLRLLQRRSSGANADTESDTGASDNMMMKDPRMGPGGFSGPPGYLRGGGATNMMDMGLGGGLGRQGAAVRETFSPTKDFQNPERNLSYRKHFQQAAEDREQDLYNTFLEMVNRIDQREANQERYDAWLKNKRNELSNFAESWRQINEGEAFQVNDNLYLVTKEPLDSVPTNAVNVVKNAQLTPQDFINDAGDLKQPKQD